MTVPADIPLCLFCHQRECSYDTESGSYSHSCHPCFTVLAAAPWCFHHDCAGRIGGRRTEWTREHNTDGEALYLCPQGHYQPMTLTQHHAAAGCHSGEADAHRTLAGHEASWLVDTRLETIGSMVNDKHPATRAHAQAYVAAALATLSAAPNTPANTRP